MPQQSPKALPSQVYPNGIPQRPFGDTRLVSVGAGKVGVPVGGSALLLTAGVGCAELAGEFFIITQSPPAFSEGPTVLFRLQVANKGL